METLILDRDRFVTVDGEKAMVYSKKRLLEQIKQAETQLTATEYGTGSMGEGLKGKQDTITYIKDGKIPI